MTHYLFSEALVGTAADLPHASDPLAGAKTVPTALYIETDTGVIRLSTGAGWVVVGQMTVGTLPLGVTSDGQTPGGLIVDGEVAIGSTGPGGPTGTLLVVTDNDGNRVLRATGYGGGTGVDLAIGDASQVATMEVETSSVSAALYAFRVINANGQAAAFQCDGSLQLKTGLGLYGFVSTAVAPRTLAQSAITAITDANAKAAVQACANALADIGALTIT